jgi:hypothetical protein
VESPGVNVILPTVVGVENEILVSCLDKGAELMTWPDGPLRKGAAKNGCNRLENDFLD